MNTYRFNIIQFNERQILDIIFSSMSKKLYYNYDGDTSDGYSYIDNNDLILLFNDTLDNTQEETLNNIITNYVYDSNYCDYKKFKINNSFETPESIDYDILGLKKNRIIVKGELVKCEYFNNFNPETNIFSDLVIEETRHYTRNILGLVQYRTQITNWILNDNSTGLTMNFTKYYSPTESIDEGIDRRNNMIGASKVVLLDELKKLYGEPTNQSYGFDLLLSVKTQMDYFSQGHTQPLRDVISASTKAYLNSDIKVKIIQELIL